MLLVQNNEPGTIGLIVNNPLSVPIATGSASRGAMRGGLPAKWELNRKEAIGPWRQPEGEMSPIPIPVLSGTG